MSILDIGSGFTGSEFLLRQASFKLVYVLGVLEFTFFKNVFLSKCDRKVNVSSVSLL